MFNRLIPILLFTHSTSCLFQLTIAVEKGLDEEKIIRSI